MENVCCSVGGQPEDFNHMWFHCPSIQPLCHGSFIVMAHLMKTLLKALFPSLHQFMPELLLFLLRFIGWEASSGAEHSTEIYYFPSYMVRTVFGELSGSLNGGATHLLVSTYYPFISDCSV